MTSTVNSPDAVWQPGQKFNSSTPKVELYLVSTSSVVTPQTIPGAIGIGQYAERHSGDARREAALSRARKAAVESLAISPLAQLRLQAGLSQSALAQAAETSQAYIARCEGGQHDPGTATLEKLAAALGIPIAKVLDAVIATRKRSSNKL